MEKGLGHIAPAGAPALSVIIAAGDNAEGLRRTVAILRAQTFDDFEMILVDDASRDATWRVMQRAEWHTLRAHRHRTRQGLSAAFNRGLEWARGDYVVFHDAGAVSLASRFEIQVAQLRRFEEIDAITSATDWVDDEGKVLHHFESSSRFDGIVSRLQEKDILDLGAAMLRRAVVEDLGGLRPVLDGAAGYDFWLRFVEGHRLKNQPDAMYTIPFSPDLPQIVHHAEREDYASLARQLAGERRAHGSEQTDPATAGDAIYRRHHRFDWLARSARQANNYLAWAERFKSWGPPANAHARTLWLRAATTWPFSLRGGHEA